MLPEFVNDPAASPVLEAIKKAKWRQARDKAKELCKKDRNRYLPLLIESNTGLAKEMIAKNQLSEAKTVLEYLSTIAPQDVVSQLRQSIENAVIVSKLAAPTVSVADTPRRQHLRNNLHALQQIKARPGGLRSLSADETMLIDETVCLCERAGELANAEPELVQISQELDCVLDALDAAANGNRPTFSECLRKIPASSIFRHWRIFLRLFEHSVHGEMREAEALLPKLADFPLLNHIAGITLAKTTNSPVSRRTILRWWLALCGEKPELAEPISEVVSAWKSNQWQKGALLLAKTFGKRAGMERVGLPFVVSEPFFTPNPQLIYEKEDFWDDAMLFYEEIVPSPANIGLVCEAFRTSLLANPDIDLEDNPAKCFEESVTLLVGLKIQLDGLDKFRDSAWFIWLGLELAKKRKLTLSRMLSRTFDGDIIFGSEALDPKRAAAAFENALELDPENLKLGVLLHEHYCEYGQTKAADKLLKQLSEKFPENKELLVMQGNSLLSRRAYTGAAEMFRKAIALDPLDASLVGLLCTSLLGVLSDTKLTRKKPNVAEWQEVESIAEKDPLHMHSLWAIRLRRALLFNDKELGEAARSAAPSQLAVAFATKVISQAYKSARLPYSIPGEFEFSDALQVCRLASSVHDCRELRLADFTHVEDLAEDFFHELPWISNISLKPAEFVQFLDKLEDLFLAEDNQKRSRDESWTFVCLAISGLAKKLNAKGAEAATPVCNYAKVVLKLIHLSDDICFNAPTKASVHKELDKLTSQPNLPELIRIRIPKLLELASRFAPRKTKSKRAKLVPPSTAAGEKNTAKVQMKFDLEKEG